MESIFKTVKGENRWIKLVESEEMYSVKYGNFEAKERP